MKFHEIRLHMLDNGHMMVQVGCKVLGFPSYVSALDEIVRYYQNPAGVQREYEEKYGWPTAFNEPVPTQTAMPSPERLASIGGMGVTL